MLYMLTKIRRDMKKSLLTTQNLFNPATKILGLVIALLLPVTVLTAQDCKISPADCPADIVVCANTFYNGQYGAIIEWTSPDFNLSCESGGGGTYDFQMSFDIPESQSQANCWDFTGVQRVGIDGGILRLWQSTGSDYPQFITPYFYMSGETDIRITLYRNNIETYDVNIFLIDAQGNTSPLQHQINVNNSHASNTEKAYEFSVTPASVGVHSILFEFITSEKNISNKNVVTLLEVDASLYGDGCSGDVNFTSSPNLYPGFFPIGEHNVVYTATYRDSNGNIIDQKSCSFNVTVKGISSASVTGINSTCGLSNGSITINSTSSGTEPDWKYSFDSGISWNTFTPGVAIEGLPAGEYSILVKDENIDCQFAGNLNGTLINETDTEDPSVTCAVTQNQTVDSNSGASYIYTGTGWDATATDNCSYTLKANLSGATNKTNLTTLNGETFYEGTTIVTWIATDPSGNLDECSFEVTVNAFGDLSVSKTLESTVVEAGGELEYKIIVVNNGPSVARNVLVADDVTAIFADAQYSTDGTSFAPWTGSLNVGNIENSALYTLYIKGTLSVNQCTDVSNTVVVSSENDIISVNNSSTVNTAVTDNIVPTITAPVATTGTTNVDCTSTNVVLGSPVVDDNCTAVADLIVTNDAPAAFALGETTVTWTVEDAAGNKATATQLVTVTDNILPTITAPVATTGTTNVDCTSTNVVLGSPVVDDNCTAVADLIVTNDAPAAFALGETTVTWTVEDAAGNKATATQLVTVTDNILPTITAPVATTGTTNVDCTSTNVVLGSPVVDDNCTAVADLIVTNDAPAAFALGETTVTWTVEDAAGNKATATQLVTVTDNILPTITAPVATTGTTNVDCTSTNVVLGSPVVDDNCTAVADLIVTNDAPAAFALGETTVTWTVEDAAGNKATATQLVTVTDNIVPTITAPVATTGTTNVDCTSTNVVLGSPVVDDNCTAVADLIVTNDAPAAFPLGETTVTWTVEDAAGNKATATQLVTVTDNIVPTITAPVATTGTTNVDCTSTNVVLGSPVVDDNCTAVADLIVTNDAPAAFALGETTVTWTVEDAAGNKATATQLVTVTDNIVPKITAPVATTGTTNVDCTSTNVVLGSPVVDDNCTAVADLIVTNDAPAAFALGETTVTWTVEDAAGNKATATQLVTVTDNILPTITAPVATTGTTNVDCTSTNVVLGSPVVDDNCTAVADLIVTNDAPAAFALGETTVTWTVEDAAGNKATATQLVTVTDNILPTITAPVATTGTTNVDCTSTNVVLGSPVVDDNCTAAADLIVTNDAPAAFALGETTVTWTVEDAAGNKATATQLVTVTDNILPTITAPVATTGTTNVDCTSTNVVLGSPVVDDNCTAVADLIVTNDAPAAFPLGETTVTWTVEDAAGNKATATQLVTVTDNILPTITAPVATTGTTNVDCTSTNVVLGSPVVDDNCTAVADLIVTNDAPAAFALGETTVTWTVEDAAGNKATATQLVTVTDNILPTITAPVATTGTTNVDCTSTNVVLGSPVVDDNCTAVADLIVTNDAPAAFALGETTVTWTVEDAAGNKATATQLVTVTDNILPTITAPVATTGTTNVDCTSTNVVLGSPVVDDNCTAVADLIVTNDAPAAFALGETTVTWTVEDAAGNKATATQLVTVTDNILPTITAPVATTGTTNVDCTSTNVVLGSPVVDDNCTAVADLIVTNDAPAAFALGETTVTWTVEDAAGNKATATQLVTVTDNILPTITAPVATTGTTNVDCTSTNVVLGSPVVDDNCTAVADLIVTNDAPAAFALGETTVTWTVEDAAGNKATATQLVTVTDNILPTITAPVATTGTTNVDCTSTNVVLGSPVVDDNCTAVADLIVTNDAPAAFALGETTVTWTVEDAAGNKATATQLVTVTDNILPTITAPVATTGTTNVDCTSTNVVLGSPVVDDNCTAVADLIVTNDAPAAFALGETTVTWTVEDAAGNKATATQLVTVTDNIVPTITAPVATTGTTNVDCTSTNVVLGSPVVDDNCTAVADLIVTNDAPAAFALGETTVTWTVEDAAGNKATATQLVTVTDNILPTITAPVDLTISTDATACSASGVNLGTPVTDDNCSVASVTNDAPAEFPMGSTMVTWTVRDASGNTATDVQTVTVVDDTPPALACRDLTVYLSFQGTYVLSQDNIQTISGNVTDNCSSSAQLSVSVSPSTFSCNDAGKQVPVVVTATDIYGNTSTCQAHVFVIDYHAPEIICPETSPFQQIRENAAASLILLQQQLTIVLLQLLIATSPEVNSR
jgi:large repetitive protein